MPPIKNPISKLHDLLAFDQDIYVRLSLQDILLIGIDEVGRGSLIGPVIAAAVSLPADLSTPQRRQLQYLNDSKQLAPSIRAELAEAILMQFPVGIGEACKAEVDTLNVHHASLLAGERAYRRLLADFPECANRNPCVLMDGRTRITGINDAVQHAIIKGDGKSACIAAASIVAKETRDRMIKNLAVEFPEYGWETNMGYPTPAHQAALQKWGPTAHHRIHYKTVQAYQS